MRKIQVLLISIIILLLCTFSVSAEHDAKTAALEPLFSLDILDRDTFDGDKIAARADFTAAVVNFMGLNLNSGTDTGFADVPVFHKYAPAIKAAVDMDIIHGYGDGTFGPDDEITTAQAVKILLSAMGYDIAAEAKGGFPNGYLALAGGLDVLDNIDTAEPLNWYTAAEIIYNCLEVDLVDDSGLLNDEYRVDKGINSLSKFHDAYKTDGILEENNITSIDNTETVGDESVRIDGEIYRTNGTDADDYLGQKVEAYYIEKGNSKLLITIKPHYDTKISEIYADDLSAGNTIDSGIRYTANDKEKTVRLDSDTSFIYNGKWTEPDDKYLNITDGSIEVISNSGNSGRADVLIITESLIYVVDTVSSAGTITDEYHNPPLTIDLNDSESFIKIENYKGDAVFDTIKPGNVLTVVQSNDKTYTYIYISQVKIKGKLEEVGENSVIFDGNAYDIIASNADIISEVSPGDTVTFLFDRDYRIAGFTSLKKAGFKYGYLISADKKGSGIADGNKGVFRIFDTVSGKIVNLESAAKISFENRTHDYKGNAYNGKNIAAQFWKNGKFADQLIKYKVNSYGEITSILTAIDNTNEPFEAFDYEFTLDLDVPGINKDISYSSSLGNVYYNGVIGGQVIVTGATALNIPKLPADEAMIDREDEIRIVDPSSNWTDAGYNNRIKTYRVYDMDEDRNAGFVIKYIDSVSGGRPAANASFMIVDRVSISTDKDGNESKIVCGYVDGKEVKYPISNNDNPMINYTLGMNETLSRGDVLRVALDNNGEIVRMIKIFSLSTTAADIYDGSTHTANIENDNVFLLDSNGYNDFFMPGTGENIKYSEAEKPTWHERYGALHCKPIKVNKSFLMIEVGNDRLERVMPLYGNVKVYKYDEKTGKLSIASISDINPLDETQSVVLRLSYQMIYDVLIIQRENTDNTPVWVGYY